MKLCTLGFSSMSENKDNKSNQNTAKAGLENCKAMNGILTLFSYL